MPAPSTERTVITLTIAGISVMLDLARLSPDRRCRIAERYASFAVEGEMAGVPKVELSETAGLPHLPFVEQSVIRIDVVSSSTGFDFTSHYECGSYDFSTRRGRLTLRQQGEPENFLRVLYCRIYAVSNALLVHASGVIRNGRGYVFFGPSGAGKTTIALLTEGMATHDGELPATILSDDLVAITRDDQGFHVHGVPFRGVMASAGRVNASARLCGLFAPVQAREHRLELLDSADAVARLVACLPFMTGDRIGLFAAMSFCQDMIRMAPVRQLYFRKDPDFWRLIDECN